jgi:hypothetical protein
MAWRDTVGDANWGGGGRRAGGQDKVLWGGVLLGAGGKSFFVAAPREKGPSRESSWRRGAVLRSRGDLARGVSVSLVGGARRRIGESSRARPGLTGCANM